MSKDIIPFNLSVRKDGTSLAPSPVTMTETCTYRGRGAKGKCTPDRCHRLSTLCFGLCGLIGTYVVDSKGVVVSMGVGARKANQKRERKSIRTPLVWMVILSSITLPQSSARKQRDECLYIIHGSPNRKVDFYATPEGDSRVSRVLDSGVFPVVSHPLLLPPDLPLPLSPEKTPWTQTERRGERRKGRRTEVG